MRELNISSTAASRKDAWRCHLALVIPSEVEESLDASVVRSKNSGVPSGFAARLCCRFGSYLRYMWQPRRQMNRRDDAAGATATKFNGRKFKRHQTHVAR